MVDSDFLMNIDQTKVGNRRWAIGNGKIQRCLLIFAYCLLVLAPQLTLAQKAVPELWGQRVHDDAHILKQETIDALEQRLKLYEDSTSNQIAVLIVPSLEEEVMEEYTLRVAETWKLGTENKDNGVLLFIAIGDRKARIEVGEGLEGALTDCLPYVTYPLTTLKAG